MKPSATYSAEAVDGGVMPPQPVNTGICMGGDAKWGIALYIPQCYNEIGWYIPTNFQDAQAQQE